VTDEIRRSVGDLVVVSAAGRTLTATSPGSGTNNGARQLQITVISKHGRTTIRAFEDLKNAAGIAFLGMTLGGGMAASIATIFSVFSLKIPALGPAVFAGVIASAVGLARTVYKRSVKNREEELRTTIQRVVARVQGSLKDSNETPP
jgi:hypothetical protein